MIKKNITFQSQNQKIVGTLFYPNSKGNLPAVIFYHGGGSRQERYFARAEALCQKGFIVLTFSFRGCGESGGEFSRQTIADGMDDALMAFDFLLSQEKVNKERIGIWGGSFGGYLAAIVSAKRSVHSLLIEAPAIYKNEWINITYDKVPVEKLQQFSDFSKNIAIEAIKQYRGSLLVIEHERDEEVPQTVVKAYYESAGTKNKKYVIIKNAPHRLEGEFYEEATRLTVEWFQSNLG